jgi:hypothetical protein
MQASCIYDSLSVGHFMSTAFLELSLKWNVSYINNSLFSEFRFIINFPFTYVSETLQNLKLQTGHWD